jgi:hypothetical protein
VRDTGAAAFAHADFDDAERFQRAQRATMRLVPKRAARSFSVPRKSPGLSFLANRSSRTCATICADSDDERPANMMRAVRLPLIETGCRAALRAVVTRAMGRPPGTGWIMGAGVRIVKIVSFTELSL